MAFADCERRASAREYWVLRGTMIGGGSTVEFAWGTIPVAHPDGPIAGRLVEPPGSFVYGPPASPGAVPERVAVALRVNNADGALDPYLLGGDAPPLEYTGPSLYTITAQLYQGYIDDDGACYEEAWTPTMVLAGPWEHRDGVISLQLASQDDRLVGASSRILSVEQVRDAALIPGTVEIMGRWPYPATSDEDWVTLTTAWTENLEAIVPWGYGRALVPLIRVSADDQGSIWVGCCTGTDPVVDIARNWEVYVERGGSVERLPSSRASPVQGWKAKISAEDRDGNPVECWIIGATVRAPLDGEEEITRVWVVPIPGGSDGYLLGALPGEVMTAADVLRALVEDHSEAGAAGIHDESFAAAADALSYSHGVVGGLFGGDGASIAEVLEHICRPVGLSLWVGPDDRLHAILPGTWTLEDAVVARGSLPSLHDADVLPGGDGPGDGSTWTETGPADAEDWGAPVSAISIQWASDQLHVFPPELTPPGVSAQRMAAAARIQITTEVELDWPGGWVHPPEAHVLLDGLAAARQFATRTVACVTRSWVARLGPGALLRARHRQGIGYDARALRVLRATVMPGEAVAQVWFEDAGALEAMRPGVLDSEEHHVIHGPTPGVALQFTAGSSVVDISSPVANATWVDCAIWTFGADDEALRRSWRIVAVLSATQVRVDTLSPATGTVTAAIAPYWHRAPWVVMRTMIHDPDYRPDYIRDCDEVARIFTDAAPGFQYT